MSKRKVTPATVKLSDLLPDGHNANRGTERGSYMIRRSIEKFGFAEAGTLDKNNRIVGGNKRTEASADLGLSEDVIVIDVDGSRPVYIRRTDIDLETKEGRELAVALNRTAQVSIDFDPEEIAREQLDGVDLSEWFFENELDELVSELTGGEPATAEDDGFNEDVDSITDKLQAEWGTERGQIWEIASEDGSRVHRVMCGDSTSGEDVGAMLNGESPRLMVTDPPYGVEYDAGWRSSLDCIDRATGLVSNDDRSDWSQAWAVTPSEVAYIWHAGKYASIVQGSIESVGFEIKSQIIWKKPHFALSRGHYHWHHEPCWYAIRKGASGGWIAGRDQSTIWEISNGTFQGGTRAEGDESTGHGTQKPIECMARPIRNHEGDVYDPFLGSGTTLIAADQLGRTCYGMEIDPGYVAVILERAKRAGMTPRVTG